jgi:hypothetical protein
MTQWIDACATDDIENEDLIRFDHAGSSYASTIPPLANSAPPQANARMRMCIWPMGW